MGWRAATGLVGTVRRWFAASRHLPIVITAILGVLASTGLYVLTASSQARVTGLEFRGRAMDHLSVINADLQDAFAVLRTVRSYFESSDQPVSRAEFTRFASTLHRGSAGLTDCVWAPRVTDAARDSFESGIRGLAYPNYTISDRLGDGRLRPAAHRPDYYPVLYQEPVDARTRGLMGLDLAGTAVRKAAIQRAIERHDEAATPPIHLVRLQETVGILSYIPVYFRSHAATAAHDAPAAEPDGLIFGAFELRKMLDSIIAAKRTLTDVDIYLFDPGADPRDRLIYWRPSGADREQTASPPSEASLRQKPHVEATVLLVDQPLGVLLLPSGGGVRSGFNWHVLLPPAVGLLLTAMSVAYLGVSFRRTRQLERLTASLQETTAGLERKTATIEHMARHDALTGLPNRRLFTEALDGAVARAVASGGGCAVMLVDLDRFKPINDLHGHAAGDAVLCVVAQRLRGSTRDNATVARLGGDEFAVIVEAPDIRDTTEAIAGRLIQAASEPIAVDGARLRVGASIGIAFCPADGRAPDTLLHAADLAMYSAKQHERGSLKCFEPGMDSDVRHGLLFEADLAGAIAAGDIRAYYQPVVRLADGALVGFEILARWHHPAHGLLMPDLFIGVAEAAGLIPALTFSLLRQACATAMDWPDHLFVALNISPVQLRKPGLAGLILDVLDQTGFPARRLEVEITESALFTSLDIARASLRALRQAGIRIALDDFGVGYSSLVHLRQLPLDKVKIDRSFVTHLLEDDENAKIVAAIIALDTTLGIATTAEGIETGDVAAHLARIGCEYGQGYHFARPMPAAEAALAYHFHPRPAQTHRQGTFVQQSAGALRPASQLAGICPGAESH